MRFWTGFGPSLFQLWGLPAHLRPHPKPPHSLMRLIPALSVPPVAIRSSTSSTRCPALTASACISILSVLYSVMYSSLTLAPNKQDVDVEHGSGGHLSPL